MPFDRSTQRLFERKRGGPVCETSLPPTPGTLGSMLGSLPDDAGVKRALLCLIFVCPSTAVRCVVPQRADCSLRPAAFFRFCSCERPH